jgi:hypothetical protein
MTTWSQYKTQRDTASATYQTAFTNLRNAMVDLLALDMVVANKAINSGSSVPVGTIVNVPENLDQLTHPEYVTAVKAPSVMDAARAQGNVHGQCDSMMTSATP